MFYWHFFPSTAFSNLLYLSITSFNYFPHKTRSSAYNISINEPSYTSSIRTSTTMINKSELKADPWWTLAFTENELDNAPSTETAVPQPLERDINPFTTYSGTLFCFKVKQITSLGTQLKAFSRSKNIKQLFIFGSEFFSKSPQNKHIINSSSSPWHKSILHFINIYHIMQIPIQNLLEQFKSMFQQLYSPIRVSIKGIPFPFKNWY